MGRLDDKICDAAAGRVTIRGGAAMNAFGAALAEVVRDGGIVLLSGTLGAGKTTLARGLITALMAAHDEQPDEIPSPTFTLVQTYIAGTLTIHHFDLYRLDRPEDVWELGWEDAAADGVVIVEWPDRLGDLPVGPHLFVEITIETDDERSIALSATGEMADRLGIAAA